MQSSVQMPQGDLSTREVTECSRVACRIDELVGPKALEGLTEEQKSQRFADAHKTIFDERVAYSARLQGTRLTNGAIPEEFIQTQEFFKELERVLNDRHRKFLASKKAA